MGARTIHPIQRGKRRERIASLRMETFMDKMCAKVSYGPQRLMMMKKRGKRMTYLRASRALHKMWGWMLGMLYARGYIEDKVRRTMQCCHPSGVELASFANSKKWYCKRAGACPWCRGRLMFNILKKWMDYNGDWNMSAASLYEPCDIFYYQIFLKARTDRTDPRADTGRCRWHEFESAVKRVQAEIDLNKKELDLVPRLILKMLHPKVTTDKYGHKMAQFVYRCVIIIPIDRKTKLRGKWKLFPPKRSTPGRIIERVMRFSVDVMENKFSNRAKSDFIEYTSGQLYKMYGFYGCDDGKKKPK